MSAQNKSMQKRVLIIGTDGLRPDCVDRELMPTCARLMDRGTLFTSFHASFPSETRVSMTTLTTGVYPGRHGVVGNLMYIPGFKETGFFQTGDDNDLMSYRGIMSEPLILRPTLGDRLHRSGKRLAIAASSSPGASLLWNLNHPGQVVNPASTYGEADLESLHRQLGRVPEEKARSKKELTLWATRALIEHHLQQEDNAAMVLWMTEPDGSQHGHGIGSPAHREALRLVDGCVAQVLEAIKQAGLEEVIDILWISDHGHATVVAQGSLGAHVQQATETLGLRTKFIVASHSIYVEEQNDSADEEIVKLIGWLQQQEWCGMMFARDRKFADLPGLLPLVDLLGPIEHRRAPDLVVQPKWDREPNEFGVPGRIHHLSNPSGLKATHGSLNPYEMHAFCLGVGPSFKEGHVSDIACGIVDIAPTVCHLIGLKAESGFDGRVLAEGLKPEALDGPFRMPEQTISTIGSENAGIRHIDVNGTRYLMAF